MEYGRGRGAPVGFLQLRRFAQPQCRLIISVTTEITEMRHIEAQGVARFLFDLKAEQGRFERAIDRAKQLLVWGIGSLMSEEQIKQYIAHRGISAN